MSYLYASEFPFKNFCILGKQAETKRHYRKQIKHCYEKLANELDFGVESFQDKLYAKVRGNKKAQSAQPVRADISIYSAISTLKNSPFA